MERFVSLAGRSQLGRLTQSIDLRHPFRVQRLLDRDPGVVVAKLLAPRLISATAARWMEATAFPVFLWFVPLWC